jgi:hypothetical protein
VSLDERLTRAARHLADGLNPPAVDLDGIRARARRNRQRGAAWVAAATVIAGIAVAAAIDNGDSSATDPVAPVPPPGEAITASPSPERPNPFPRSMTPEQVVNDARAELWTVAVAPGDPDTRISMWSVRCSRPCPQRGPGEFNAVALTTDGYDTTMYLRPPYSLGVDLQVSTPEDGTFLVTDQSNGGEWLVELDGDIRPVTRVDTELRPTDPRLWFPCPSHWRSTWCALDPGTATAYAWPRAWDGSAASPASGDAPWGANPEPRATSSSGRLEAWWDTEDGRRLRTLAETHEGDYILGSPPGEMAYWARPDDTSTVELHTSRNRGKDWEVDSRAVPGLNAEIGMKRSPDGAYLAYSTYPELVIWRAEAAGGPFRKVYEQSGKNAAETSGAGLWTQDGLVYANAYATAAISEDDGLSWTTIHNWR